MTTLTTLLTLALDTINQNEQEIAKLDQAIGDGDHIVNLQRGLNAVIAIADELETMEWSAKLMKIGMTLMSTMGGASGSLFGSCFVAMSKAAKDQELNFATFTSIFEQGVESIKQRGKADIGEKTMLDTLIPAVNSLNNSVEKSLDIVSAMTELQQQVERGMLSTKDMLATKGRASFLGERAIGHIDAGARTTQLMIDAIAEHIKTQQA
jgi:dihydroxyacetone kinase-like protein